MDSLEDPQLAEDRHLSEAPAFKQDLLFLNPRQGYEIRLNGRHYMTLFTLERSVFGRLPNGRIIPLSLVERYGKDGLILASQAGEWTAFAPVGTDIQIVNRIFTEDELSLTATKKQATNDVRALAFGVPALMVAGYFCSDLAQATLREVATNWIAFESYLRSGWFMQP